MRDVFTAIHGVTLDIDTCTLRDFEHWHKSLQDFSNRFHLHITPELQAYIDRKKKLVKGRDEKVVLQLARSKGRETRNETIEQCVRNAMERYYE